MRIGLKDSSGLCQGLLVLTPAAFQLATLMDGTRTVPQISQSFEALSGQPLATEILDQFLQQLDANLALDNHSSRNFLKELKVRPAAHQGPAYPSDPDELKSFLDDILRSSEARQPEHPLLGLMVPHIDLRRGAQTYGKAFQELRTQLQFFDTFVILGITHAFSAQPFVLTRLNFATPLGVVETDEEFVDELAGSLDFDPFEDEFNHLGEHSVEFQAVILRHMLARPFRIVPVLCGSLHRCLMGESPISPRRLRGVEKFVTGLKSAVASRPRTLILASVDLAHQGERFDGPRLDQAFLEKLAEADRSTLQRALQGDSEGFIASLQADRGARNYCGTSAIYIMLEALGQPQGSLYHYQQCNEPGLTSTVTVAAAGFYQS